MGVGGGEPRSSTAGRDGTGGGGKKRKADETADASDAADKSSKPRVADQLSRAEISRAVALMLAKTRKVRER